MKSELKTNFNSIANDIFRRFLISPAAEQESALLYWRERILFYTILSGSVLGFIAYVPSIYLYTASYIIAHNFFNEVFGFLHILN